MSQPPDPDRTGQLAELAASYDEKYDTANHFNYRPWLYRRFIRALVAKSGLQNGAQVLDAGCGQGFFTSLLAECGLNVLGVDISRRGIEQARQNCRIRGARFEVGDVYHLPYASQFDAVFTRSCSLYNDRDFATERRVTEALLKYVRPGGVLIFDYYTKLSARRKSDSWMYHSVAAGRQHFAPYPGSQVFFSLRWDALLLGKPAFSLSCLSVLASRLSGVGGDLIAIVPRH